MLAWKQNMVSKLTDHVTFALLVQWSSNWAMKPSTLVAGKFVGLRNDKLMNMYTQNDLYMLICGLLNK